MYFGPPCYGYALNWHLVSFAIPGTRPLCMKLYMQPQKVKFKSVQINIKHVYVLFEK